MDCWNDRSTSRLLIINSNRYSSTIRWCDEKIDIPLWQQPKVTCFNHQISLNSARSTVFFFRSSRDDGPWASAKKWFESAIKILGIQVALLVVNVINLIHYFHQN